MTQTLDLSSKDRVDVLFDRGGHQTSVDQLHVKLLTSVMENDTIVFFGLAGISTASFR
jgi:hypothetical protein